jgi:3-hydroxyisobutyrate dehydrogenase
MGYAMARRLLQGGTPVTIWNRTRAKAELAGCDTVFCILATAADLEAVCFGEHGIRSGARRPGLIVDASTIGLTESVRIRRRRAAEGVEFIAAPVGGNAQCVRVGTAIESPCEGTRLAQRAGVSRHVWLEFLNTGVLGSTFTRYKSAAHASGMTLASEHTVVPTGLEIQDALTHAP